MYKITFCSQLYRGFIFSFASQFFVWVGNALMGGLNTKYRPFVMFCSLLLGPLIKSLPDGNSNMAFWHRQGAVLLQRRVDMSDLGRTMRPLCIYCKVFGSVI